MIPDSYTAEDVFYELSTIRDPEKTSCTLADLDVVAQDRCSIDYHHHVKSSPAIGMDSGSLARVSKPIGIVRVVLKPTVPHCSLMSLICLCVYAKLKDTLPPWMCDWKIDIKLVDGSHLQQHELEKQVADKERVAAALENRTLSKEIAKLINADAD
ncbi:putative MIP18 family protein [Trypanosoma grayi]|uniref:putative MIP18 family protein n=1 Tax=Trypanosoma grayi TaxID=71804 RepID=UPI0004F4971D|nr:putative MIP18 family protein [Trypanosoma grayi]KEG07256.1 putative MIP18 family protein [Trypanosoma grayi]